MGVFVYYTITELCLVVRGVFDVSSWNGVACVFLIHEVILDVAFARCFLNLR